MDAEEVKAGILRPDGPRAHSPSVSDAELDSLLRRFLERDDEGAMEELVRRTRPRLLGAARRIGHPQDAEDSVQAAYHALLRKGREPMEGPVVAWLLTAVIRIAYRRKASSARREDLARRLAPRNPDPDPAARLAAAEEAVALRRALDRLPDAYRDALVLHHLQGLPVADVAVLQEAPESTVKARLRRGRALLRTRLPRSLHFALAAVPWAAEDAFRAAVAGGIMKAKAAAAALLLALAALGGGALWLLAPAPRAERPRVPVASVAPTPPPPPSATPEPAPPAVPAAPDSAPAPPPPLPEEIPQKVRDAAEALKVSAEALRAAWEAYESGRRKAGDVSPHFLEALRRHGPDGFRAVVALLRGDLNGTWFRDLAGVGWRPGLEGLLMETADDTSLHVWSRWSALDCLGNADCPESRDYLARRVERETDAGLFYSAAGALARLREPGGAPSVALRIEEVGWGETVRSSLMVYLTEMDPDAARRVLVQRIGDPRSDLLGITFRVLQRLDPEAAKREAEALLDGPRRETLDRGLAWWLRDLVGRPQPETDAR